LYTVILEFLAWLAGFFGRRLALILTFTSLITAFYTTMILIVAGATAGVVAAVPSWVTDAAAIFLPSQLGLAMAAVMTARVARWVFDWSWKIAAIAVILH